MSDAELDDLLEALATTIVSRQGKVYREQAKHVLEVIDAQGWTLVRKEAP